jgi:hypothetical protein
MVDPPFSSGPQRLSQIFANQESKLLFQPKEHGGCCETDTQNVLAHAIRIERVSKENSDAEKKQSCSHDLGHRCTPWVAAMPKRAALRKWR